MEQSELKFNAEDLIRLAQDKSDTARSELVENVTDLFLSSGGRLNEHERVLMDDILTKLISSVEQKLRRELSIRLVDIPDLSPGVAELLANDTLEISRPFLERSGALADEQLIEIVRNRTEAHRMAIAIRAHVSEDLSSEIIEHSDEDVIEALIRNENAEISKISMEYLVAESRSYDRFQEPLLSRGDIPAELAYRMYWWVSAALRRKIMSEFSVDETRLDDAIEMATKAVIQNHDEEDNAMATALRLVKKLALERKLNVDFMLTSLRQDKVNLAVAGLSELSGLDVVIIWRAFRERTGESMAIIAKSIEMEREHFMKFFLLVLQSRSGNQGRATKMLNSILSMYDTVDIKNAKAAVRYWQRDFGYQEALSQLKEVV